jgi:hypothetical protein
MTKTLEPMREGPFSLDEVRCKEVWSQIAMGDKVEIANWPVPGKVTHATVVDRLDIGLKSEGLGLFADDQDDSADEEPDAITQEMIEAGVDALNLFDAHEDSPSMIVRAVFRAMLEASRQS